MPLDGSSPPLSADAVLARLVGLSVFIALKALCSLVVKAVCAGYPFANSHARLWCNGSGGLRLVCERLRPTCAADRFMLAWHLAGLIEYVH